jgi:outer membrane protein assembly factor BamA
MLTLKTLSFCFVLVLVLSVKGTQAQELAADPGIIYSTGGGSSLSDTTHYFTITDIVIEGNKKTKDKILLRELPFAVDQDYPLHVLIGKFNEARQQLLNTTLFESVNVALKTTEGDAATVLVTVKERWYFFPEPVVDVVDESLQEWSKKMDFNRINYGIKLKHKNISGLNDKLYLNLINGYTKGASLRYEGLPLDYNLKWSAGFSFSTGKNRDISYNTIQNKQVAFNGGNNFVYSYTHTSASISYRPAIKTRHTLGLSYHTEKFMDTITSLNKNFMNNNSRVSYPELFYQFQYRDLNFIPYPTKGYAADILFQKKGLNDPLNVWQLTARTAAFKEFNSKYFMHLSVTGVIKLPFDQPWSQKQFVGHNSMYLQGYEDYVIDGVAGGFAKASFNRSLINKNVHIPSKRFACINDIPVKVYGKIFGNSGYVYNKLPGNNTLNNRLLYSGGFGIDIVLFYDVTFRFEYSINHLGQNGLYLHDKNTL